jgi:hypothetical protein
VRTAILVVMMTACGSARAPSTPVIDVGASLDAVRADFDAHAGEARFVALLSPT